jgi:hypothetical protein
VTASVTLSSSTVSYTGISTNSAVDNLLGLYGAIRDSVDPVFTNWDWDCSYPATQGADDGNTYIYGKNKTAEADKTFTGTNVTAGWLSYYVQAGFQTDESLSQSQTVTTDLVNGFIYYLQINARGIALATKTNTAFYGPIHACWGLHSAAMAYRPIDTLFLTPIELIIGYDDDANNEDSWGISGSFYIISPKSASISNIRANYVMTPPGGGARRQRFHESLANTFTLGNGNSIRGQGFIQLKGSGIFIDDYPAGNDFQVHRVKTIGFSFSGGGSSGAVPGYLISFVPGYELEDWYKFRGTANDEALTLIADTVGVTTLASIYTPGDTVLNLTDASGIQTAGFVIIGIEAFQYTGKTGNQLTGVTGAKYATIASRHFVGDSVGQGMWFVKINGGAIFAGYVKPS